jgi:hypothetical protein
VQDEAREFFGAVEEHFVRRRGRPLLLSPGDVSRVARWHADGIPLKAVIDGIDLHFDRMARRGKAPRRAVTLAYLEDDVLDAWAGVRQRRLGRRTGATEAAAPEPLATPDEHRRLVEELEAAAKRLAASAGEPEAKLVAAVAAGAAKLRGKAGLFDAADPDHDEQRAEEHLRRLEKSLLTSGREALGPALFAVEAEVEREIADKRARMGEASWQRVRGQLVDKRVRERFGLPRLSLLYI